MNPNPAASDLTVTVKSNGAYTVDLHIADVTGGAIQKHTLNLVDGENKVPLMVDSLQVGVYYIIIYHNGTPVTKATFQKI
ncbi:MAG: T9SS type A sorting domain-containing protein [Saprospiraceae bacterium]|nr:T9SS type A sorting domain-containing protein [Saprospiraceae bacterium]